MEAERDRLTEKREALLAAEPESLNITQDGVEIPTLANIELPMEVSHGVRNKAQGVGLYRTEYLFLNRPSLPTEEEQYQAYRAVVEAMRPHPVVLRTLDLGGDKFASNIHVSAEINPQLGWRAIRFCLERPDIFKTQLRALLRASVHGDVQIMFPLISGVDEFEQVMEVTRGVMADLEKRGVAFNREVKIGTMIEVPSAVAMAEELAERCDFFSVGTNDLIQYSLAVDRGNEKIAHMYEPAHPAVLRMLRQTAKAARRAKIPCGICGEMAGDPLFTELLVGLGFTSLSMSAVAIPLVRAEIANIHVSRARRFARRVLGMWSAPEIRTLMMRRFRARQGENDYGEAVEAAFEQRENWSD
jgi:phosphotransferase system enzyme I (PtsI)